jgi:hypothetical protein
MAAGLEERGIPAPRGGNWSAVQVARLLEAAAVPFDASAEAAEESSKELPNRSDIQLTFAAGKQFPSASRFLTGNIGETCFS